MTGFLSQTELLFWQNVGGHFLDGDLVARPTAEGTTEGDPYFWAEPCRESWALDGLQLGPRSAALGQSTTYEYPSLQLGVGGGPNADITQTIDEDEDDIPDSWEKLWGLDPSDIDPFDDLDGDGLSNMFEYDNGLDPTSRDTDNDGIRDQDEFDMGMDPRAPMPDMGQPGPRL